MNDQPTARRHPGQWATVLAMAAKGINSPLTSSAGRLFDAAAALIGVRDIMVYEGQPAIELEQLADQDAAGHYPVSVTASPAAHHSAAHPAGHDEPAPLLVHGADLIRAAACDLAAGTPPALISARFHNGVAAAITAVCERLRDENGLGTVALSGGVFQNLLLLEGVAARLEAAGFEVLTHSRVPCNDGGISLGQAVVAAAVAGRSA